MDRGPLEVKQLFFNNLQLLGFDVVAMEATNHIPFNKNMFELPNKRAAEIVLHFLFEKLNPTMCREAFRDIWPILDKKREQAFRKTCATWLGNIAQEEPDSHLPRINASLFMTPGGDKFYQLLVYFSTYVLQKILDTELAGRASERLKYPALSSQNAELGNVMLKNLLCSSVRHRKSYFDIVQLTLKARKTWKETADESVKDYRKLSKEIRELDYAIREEEQRAVDNSGARGSPTRRYGKIDNLDPNFDPRTIQRAQRVQHVREMWKQLDDFERTQAAEREIIESIVERTINKHKIDAADISVKVPDMLLRECEEEIRRRNVSNTYQGGRLNLESVLQLWNLSLHLYLEKLKQTGMPKFDNDLKKLTSQVHVQQNYLQNARTLRSQMTERIPVLKESIEKLRTQLDSAMFKDETPTSIRTTSLGLGLVEPSPQLNFSPGAADPQAQQIEVPRSPRNLETPEAADRVREEMKASVGYNPKQLFPEEVELLLQPGMKDSAIPRPTPSKVPSQPSSRQSSRPTSSRSSTSARGSVKSNKSSTRSTKQASTPRDRDTVFPTVSSPKTMVAKFNQDFEKIDFSVDSFPLSARSNLSSSSRSDKSGNSSSTAKASHSPRSVKSQSSGRSSARLHDQEHGGARQGRKTPTDLLVDEIMGEGKILSPFNSGLEAFESRNLVNRTPDLEDENKENVEPSEEYHIRHDYNSSALTADSTDENVVDVQTNEIFNGVNEKDYLNENEDVNEYNEERECIKEINDIESMEKIMEISEIKLVSGQGTDDDGFEEIHGPELEDECDNDGNDESCLSEGSNRSVENVIVIDKSFNASPKHTPVREHHFRATKYPPVEDKVPSLETSPREPIVVDHSIQRSPVIRVDRDQVRRDLLSKSLTLERSPLSQEIRQMFEKALAETRQRPNSAFRLHDSEDRLRTYGHTKIDVSAPDKEGLGEYNSKIDDELELPNMDINSRQMDPAPSGKAMFIGDILWDLAEGLDDIEMPEFDLEMGFEGDTDNDMKEPKDDFNNCDKDVGTEKDLKFSVPGIGDIENIDDFFLSKSPEFPSRHQGMLDKSSSKEDGNELFSIERSSLEIPKFPQGTDEEEHLLITF